MARRPSPSRLSPALRAPAGAAGAGGPGAPAGLASGSVGYGGGGAPWLDAHHAKRAPQPHELVNAFKSIAYACVGLNARGVAKVPLRLYAVRRSGQAPPRRSWRPAPDRLQRRIRGAAGDRGAAACGLARSIDTNDEVDEVLEHPLLDAVGKPNPYFDRELFLQYLTACLDAVGSAFVFPERPPGPDGYGDPAWASRTAWPLQPQYVFPVKGTQPGKLIEAWQYFGDTFGPSELVRARHVSLRDPYLSGYAPLHACYEQTSLVDYYTSAVEGLLSGGARPETVVTAKDPLFRMGEDERERYEKDVNRKFRGPRQGRVWFVDGAFDVHTLSYPPTDLGGLELTKEQRLLAANCFDVPISLLQLEDSNRATAQESTHQHQYYAIDPRCRMLAAAFTAQWAQPVDDRLFFFFDDPVTRDVEQEARVWAMKVEKGQATRNEWRGVDGLPPVEGGDVILVANNLVPLASAGAPPEGGGGGEDKGDPAAPPPGDDVQAQALNGAQVASLVEVLQNVRDGVLPPDSARAVLAAAFPLLTPDLIDRIVSPIEVKPPEPEPAPPGGEPGPDGGPDPGPAERSAPATAADIDARIVTVLGLLESRLRADAEPEPEPEPQPDPEPDPGPDGADDGGGGAVPE